MAFLGPQTYAFAPKVSRFIGVRHLRSDRHRRLFSSTRPAGEMPQTTDYIIHSLSFVRSSNHCQSAITSQGGVSIHKYQIPCHSNSTSLAMVNLLLTSFLRIMNMMHSSWVLVARGYEQRLVWPKLGSIQPAYQSCSLREVIP